MTDLASASGELRLDLACGQRPREGFEGVDLYACPGVKHVVNLWQFPWPWESDSVAEIHCSHHVEHIPMAYVAADGKTYKAVPDAPGDLDLFLRFFDECYRILKPGGRMTVICPTARSNRGFQDPTHRRFIVQESFFYLSRVWRTANGLDHYLGACDFDAVVEAIGSPGEEVYATEVIEKRYLHYWNVVADWKATLTAKKAEARPLPASLPLAGAAEIRLKEKPAAVVV